MLTLPENQLPLCAYHGVNTSLNPRPPAITHTHGAQQKGCDWFILWPLKEWQLTARHCQFWRGSGRGTHCDWQRGPQPAMPGNSSSPSWQGRIRLAPSPPGRKSVMLSLPEARAHQWLHRWHEDPCAAWKAFRDIIFTNAMLTRVAASTSLGKKLISITNNTFLIAANRYGIPEITPLATDKSPPSPLAFSAMEKREDVSTRSCKKERWSQHLLRDSLLPLINYSTFRARQMQLPPAPSPPWATSPALPSIGPSPLSLFLLWSYPNWEREGIWGTHLWRGKFLCTLTKAISGTSLPSPDFRMCRVPPVKALGHQPALAAPGPEDHTKTHRPND